MKRSNLLLLILTVIMLGGLVITDHLLTVQYHKTALDDPYKNFEQVAVQPFKVLKISGGNGYVVKITQDKKYGIRLRSSRKSFFSMKASRDTLKIGFSVANQNYQKPEDGTIGLIIGAPMLELLVLSGTNNELGPFQQYTLAVIQDKNTVTRLNRINAHHLNLRGTGISYFDFQLSNVVKHLSLELKNNAVASFHQIGFEQFSPVLQDSSSIIVNRQALEMLQAAVHK